MENVALWFLADRLQILRFLLDYHETGRGWCDAALNGWSEAVLIQTQLGDNANRRGGVTETAKRW